MRRVDFWQFLPLPFSGANLSPEVFEMRRKSPFRQFLPVIATILVVGAVVAFYGLTRSAAPTENAPEVQEQIALAEKLLSQGEPEKALRAVEKLRGEDGERALGERASLLRLQALDAAGMHEEAGKAADEFLAEFKESESKTGVELLRLGSRVADAGLSNPDLLAAVEEFIAKHPDHEGTPRLELALARHSLRIGDTQAAQRRLRSAMRSNDLDRDVLAEVQREMGDLNLQRLVSGVDGDVYTVKSGDSVWEIATKSRVTPELLMKVNGISDPKRLRVGQTLRIPAMDFSLVCDVSANSLTLYNHGEFVKVYPVRTGRVAGTTPTGDFRILNKKQNPVWRPGDGRVYQPGDPNNELGSRWMAFEGDILGIHGTIHPETVGEYASNGCIGLTRGDVEELFDLVTVGTPLTIKGEQDTSRARVIPAPDVPDPLSDSQLARAN